MIDPAEALSRLLALARSVDVETLPLEQTAGRWAATTIAALRTQPARDLSAMDGYAVRHADLPGPWQVIGESAAGAPFAGKIKANQAARIFTGAALPEGADCIVIQEHLSRTADQITLDGEVLPAAGQHVRLAGSDFTVGTPIISSGDRITPGRIGLAAIAGHANLPVRRCVRVALISTGNELCPLGADPGLDRLPASNALMLSALLANLPANVADFGIIPDDQAALTAAFTRAADHDIIVTTGGASVGDHDLVRPALVAAGASIDFWKVAMRPGKPLMAGRLDNAVALGLPGNPVSAFVTATLFLKPLIAHLGGASDPAPLEITAILATNLPEVGIRTDYVRARWQDGRIAPLSGDSGMLVPLAAAAVLIVRPAGSPPAVAGDSVTVIPLT